MSESVPLIVKVWGDLACFTRPEMKVERVTYEVMTPSAARGVLEAIFWKPEIRWRVRAIHVLRPIRRFSIMRNEVKSKAVVRTARKWAEEGEGGFYADDDRTQRHTLALRDVAYRIEADIVLLPHATEPEAKYRAMFRRRVEKGQCFQQPYLGCREFAASFAEDDGEAAYDLTDDLGRMLFDLAYNADGSEALPRFFQARLDRGVLHVPQALYDEVEPLGREGGGHAPAATR